VWIRKLLFVNARHGRGIGEGYSDTLRTIIMNWLSEKGYFTKGEKNVKE